MGDVPRHPDAFARPMFKTPRVKDKAHLRFVSQLPCLITGRRPVDVCHIRYGDRAHGKRETGMQEKPSDCWTVPMHRNEHFAQHSMNEREFWAEVGIDPLEVARALFRATGDLEEGERIIFSFRRQS